MDGSADDSDFDQTYSDPDPNDANSEMQDEEEESKHSGEQEQASFSPIGQPDAEMEDEEQSFNSYHEEMNDQQIQSEWQNQWT